MASAGDIEVVFDNGAEATIAYIVEAWAQIFTTISVGAPQWSEATRILAPTKVGVGATALARLQLPNYFQAYLFIRAMRCTNSSPSAGIYIAVRRIMYGTPSGGAGSVDITHSQPLTSFNDSTTASNATTIALVPAIPGATLGLGSGTGMAANQLIGICDSTTTPTVFECGRTSKVSTATITFDRNLTNTALTTSDVVTNNAIILPPIAIDGTPN